MKIFRSVLSFGWLVPFIGSAITAAAADDQARNPTRGLRFDGVYAAALPEEKDAAGKPRWIVVRLYKDGSTVEAEFHGTVADCKSWLRRENERLLPGRWELDGDQFTVLESTGMMESERTGKVTVGAWVTTPRVKVKYSNGWQLEPVNRPGDPLVTFRFTQVQFGEGRGQEAGNRRPFFMGVGEQSRHFDYDRAGNIQGISEEFTVQAADLDQDQLAYSWKASNGVVTGEGPRAVWKRELVNGKPVPGTISVEINDGRGGKITYTREPQAAPTGGWTLYR